MTIFYRDVSEAKRAMLEAIERHRRAYEVIDQLGDDAKYERQDALYNLQLAIEQAADIAVPGPWAARRELEWKIVTCVALRDQDSRYVSRHDRAKKIVDALDDRIMRLWIAIPLLILMWPFVFVWRLLKMGVPR